MDSKDMVRNLLACDIFRVGNFKLKSGSFSPIYIDLRRIINYPRIIKDLANFIKVKETEENLTSDVVCGVPYTALPIASVYSVLFDVPMVMKRKEAKDHGTKKMVEGNIRHGDLCLIIEDIVSSGTSIIETAEALRNEGLKVQDCIVVVNRNQGGVENLLKAGIKLYPLFDINSVFEAYCALNPVEAELVDKVNSYFKGNSYLPVVKMESNTNITFSEREKLSDNSVAKKLFNIMNEKKTNLCVAVDTNFSYELLDLANKLGPHICLLKTHIDILSDFSEDLIENLKKLSKNHNFLIMEDRKFADIGNTVIQQFLNGLYKIQTWADMVTVHALPGSGIIEALKNDKCACVLVAEMSSRGALTNSEYKESVFKMSETYHEYVIGYVAQHKYPNGKNLLHMCPGVNLSSSGDSLGQQYKSPEEAVANGADIIIVGRGICKASDVVASAVDYKVRSFDAYLRRISQK